MNNVVSELEIPAGVELKILVRRREPEAVVDEPPPEPPGRLDAAGVPFVEGDEIAAADGGRRARDTPEDVGADAADAGGHRTARRGHEFATTNGGPRHRLTPEDVGADAAYAAKLGGRPTTRRGHEFATTNGGPRRRLGGGGVGVASRGLYDRNYPTLYTRGIRCIDFLRDGLQFVSQLLVLLEESLVHPLQFLEPLLDRHRSSSGHGRSRTATGSGFGLGTGGAVD